jgi:hypothetical protein
MSENAQQPEENKEVPMDLFIDMAITFDKLKDKFNLNDDQLEEVGLDWWYFHKLANRSRYFAEQLGVKFDE